MPETTTAPAPEPTTAPTPSPSERLDMLGQTLLELFDTSKRNTYLLDLVAEDLEQAHDLLRPAADYIQAQRDAHRAGGAS